MSAENDYRGHQGQEEVKPEEQTTSEGAFRETFGEAVPPIVPPAGQIDAPTITVDNPLQHLDQNQFQDELNDGAKAGNIFHKNGHANGHHNGIQGILQDKQYPLVRMVDAPPAPLALPHVAVPSMAYHEGRAYVPGEGGILSPLDLVPYDPDTHSLLLDMMDPSDPAYKAFALELEPIDLPEKEHVSEVIQFANRVPTEDSFGGLVETAIHISRQYPGAWWGTTEDKSKDGKLQKLKTRDGLEVETKGIFVDEDDYKKYYKYVSTVDWFKAHDLLGKGKMPEGMEVNPIDEEGYQAKIRVNKAIGELCNQASDDAVIIFHDNHLSHAARYTDRETTYVIHTPFPDVEMFRMLPHAKEELADMLQNRLIVVQTERNRQKLKAVIEEFFGADDGLEIGFEGNSMTIKTNDSKNGRPTVIDVIPVGVEPESFRKIARTKEALERAHELAMQYLEKELYYSYGRTDPAKGQANFLEQIQGKMQYAINNDTEFSDAIKKYLVYLIYQPDSRLDTHISYPDEQKRTGVASAEINRLNDRDTIIYQAKPAKGTERSALLHLWGSIMTSFEEGFGLSGIEGIVATLNKRFKALISKNAGSRELLEDTVISFDPRDPDSIIAALDRVLTMSDGEAGERLFEQRKRLLMNTVMHWSINVVNRSYQLTQRDRIKTVS